MLLSELPHELILEVYRCLYDGDSNTQLANDKHRRHSWTLNILSTCMVCQSWYMVGSEYLSMRRCMSPFFTFESLLHTVESTWTANNPTWSQVLLESQRNKLQFHTYPRQIILDLSPLLNVPSSPLPKSSLKEPNWETERFCKSVQGIIKSCAGLTKMEICYDSRYSPRTRSSADHNRASRTLEKVALALSEARTLTHLIFSAREPMQKCPCCAGRGWDHILRPLLQSMSITVLELDHVLPSRAVLECMNQIDTMIIRGHILTQASRLARYGSTPPRIPLHLLTDISTLEIYLHNNSHNDDEELDLLAMFRQTYDIIHPIPALQRLILHGKEKFNITWHGSTISNDVWRKLELLAERHHLESLVLENIPGFRCPTVQSKLQHVFMDAAMVNVVYNT